MNVFKAHACLFVVQIHILKQCLISKQFWLKCIIHPVKAIINKSQGSDSIVGELIKYGGKTIWEILLTLLE